MHVMCNFGYLLEDAVAPPRRLDGGVYEQLRAIQRSITKDMYDYAVRAASCSATSWLSIRTPVCGEDLATRHAYLGSAVVRSI